MTETISQPDRLNGYNQSDFLSSQPYKKVLRVFKQEGKLAGKITTYHPNGLPWQYLEALDMRAFGPYNEWHANGQLKIEATVIGGTADVGSGSQKNWLFDGRAQIWDEMGRLQAQIFYSKGSLEGPSFHFYPTGQVQRQMIYSQNELEGVVTDYYIDGEVETTTAYKRGVKNGFSYGYWNGKQPRFVENYQTGLLLDGQYYAQDGRLSAEVRAGSGYQALFNGAFLEKMIEHRRGKAEGLVKVYFSNGDLKTIYQVKNGQKQGEEIEYYAREEREDQGSQPLPKISIPWDRNMISGIVKTWYSSGKLQSQRELSRNKKAGTSLGWYQDGGLMYMEEYEDDRLTRGQYHKKNHKDPISTIVNGNGFATLYDEAGVLLRKVHYIKGKAVDPEN
jgi:antitoxin component YwqK of YwqJK toxin-antitoxin module